jgi:hypothetical protein
MKDEEQHSYTSRDSTQKKQKIDHLNKLNEKKSNPKI